MLQCANKKAAGFGVKDLFKMNKGLLCTWIWRYSNERDSPGRKVICWKFGEERGGWCSRITRGAYGTSVWKEIKKEWDTIFPLATFSLGNCNGLHFWLDVWFHKEAFCDSLPSLFSMVVNKETLISNL